MKNIAPTVKLKHAARAGIAWTSLGVFINATGQIALLAVLARNITPEDFGIANAALIIFAFGANVFEGGVGLNIAQRKVLTQRDIATASQISIGIAAAMAILIITSRNLLAEFFEAPQLSSALCVVAGALVIGGLVGPQDAVLLHQRRYKTATAVATISFVIGYAVVATWLALKGVGLMAIVYGHLGMYIIKAVLLLCVVRNPLFIRSTRQEFLDHVRGTFLFSIGRLAAYVSNQADKLVVGRVIGMEALGVYGRAHQIMMVPNKVFMQAVARVVTPLYSSIQDERERIGSVYVKSIKLSLYALVPVFAFAFAFRDRIVSLLLGPGWGETADILTFLAIAGLFHVLYKVPLTVLHSQKAARSSAISQSIFAAILLVSALVIAPLGVIAVAMAVALITGFNYLILTAQVIIGLPAPVASVISAHIRGLAPGFIFLMGIMVLNYVFQNTIHEVVLMALSMVVMLLITVGCLRNFIR